MPGLWGVEDHSALHAFCQQSPTPESLHQKGKTLVGHYPQLVQDYATDIKALTPYVVVDGYFMKKEFSTPLLFQGLHLITKARSAANLCYVYKGKLHNRGRKRIRDSKIDVSHLEKRRIGLMSSTKEKDVYVAMVYSELLKRKVLAAFIYYKDLKTGKYKSNRKGKVKPEIIIATDIEMKPRAMCTYYELCFQVEFFIRDSKSYAGLQDCQARSKDKLHTHFNIAMTAVSVAKAA